MTHDSLGESHAHSIQGKQHILYDAIYAMFKMRQDSAVTRGESRHLWVCLSQLRLLYEMP